MNMSEIALQLTLKAMDKNYILTKDTNDGKTEEVNAFNAKQISDFYNSVYAAIKTEEFVAQSC